jgi:hypothetical protein
MEFFTLLLKGSVVAKFLHDLAIIAGLEMKYNVTISLVKCVPLGYKDSFPVRNQSGKNLLSSSAILTNDRVLCYVRCKFWENKKKGKKGIEFQLQWIRKLVDNERIENENAKELGEDDGPIF